MTFQWIPLDALEPHPENSNRMPPHLLEKLKGHIRRTGLYEPLVVRPLVQPGTRNPERGAENKLETRSAERGTENELETRNAERGTENKLETRSPERGTENELETRNAERGAKTTPSPLLSVPGSEFRAPRCRYQILNGHHRVRALRELGHTHARCDVWEVDDAEARLLLATLNRLEGRDDPSARALLVSRLADGRTAEDLARLLPEPPDAVERLLRLAQPPPAPLGPDALEPIARPMTFFLTEEQHALVSEALREINKRGTRNPERGTKTTTPSVSGSEFRVPSLSRSDALERLALWYLESRNLR